MTSISVQGRDLGSFQSLPPPTVIDQQSTYYFRESPGKTLAIIVGLIIAAGQLAALHIPAHFRLPIKR